MRRSLLSILLLVCAAPVAGGAVLPRAQAAPAAAPLADRRQDLESVFNDYWQDTLEHAPEFASELGDKRYNDRISDYSVAAVNEKLARHLAFLLRVAAIDPAGFTPEEQLSREILLEQLTEEQEAARFNEWEMPVTQMDGIQTVYPQLVAELTFTTVKDYDDWIARLHAIPRAFDQVTANMTIGIDDHRVPPKYLLEKALDQVNELAQEKPEDSPFALPLKEFPASVPAGERERIRGEMLSCIGKQVLPAYAHFASFLRATYIPAGREQPGIWALPDGEKYYQYCIRHNTTTNLTADEIHQIGVEEVKRDEAKMLAIARKLGFSDLQTFRASLKTNAKLHPASAEALLAAYRGYLDPMETKLPQLFGRLPKAKLEVAPVPAYLEQTAAPAYYEPGAADGSRPGRLRVNTYHASSRNLYAVEAVTYHEGLPGHHLQISIAQELDHVPAFRKYEHFTAYTEGWGLYAEQLGKTAGFYQDPYSDYGRLEADVWRAIRLVVDTGVHHDHWTRQQMVDYFHEHSAIDEPSVQAEVDRYIAWPGQALAYKIGELKIVELRNEAQKELGDKFDLRAFHDQILDAGALPLNLLARRIDTWIARQKSTGP